MSSGNPLFSPGGFFGAPPPAATSSRSSNGGSAATGNTTAAAASSGSYAGSNSFGLASGADADVLQLDALLLRVQLNLRSLLLQLGRGREVNIISEKVGTEQDTRFEDRSRLPLGVPINLHSYTAALMAHLAFCPSTVLPRTFGSQIDPLFADADVYTAVNEEVSFWQLMRRAQLLGHVLLGYYLLPVAVSDPIQAVLCPPGQLRYEKQVWNTGDNRCKFIILQDVANVQQQRRHEARQQQQRDEDDLLTTAGTQRALSGSNTWRW
eukprot:gene2624-2925_t